MITEPEPNTVLKFPAHRIVRDQAPEEQAKRAAMRQMVYMNGIVEDMSKQLLMNLFMAGVDLSNKVTAERFSLTIELLRATLYSSIEKEHLLHDAMDGMIEKIKSFQGGEMDALPDIEMEMEDDGDPGFLE